MKPLRILFVCHGNICRSPMAEFCMKDLVRKAGLEDRYEISSAATSSEELGEPVYPPARRVLASHGIDCAGKRARQITRDDYDRFDLIVGMDHSNLRGMMRVFGSDPQNKVLLLSSFSGRREDVDDPWYTRDFDYAWLQIEEGCRAMLGELTKQE